VLLVFGAPCQYSLLAGREHGRTIPLAEFALGQEWGAADLLAAMQCDAQGMQESVSFPQTMPTAQSCETFIDCSVLQGSQDKGSMKQN